MSARPIPRFRLPRAEPMAAVSDQPTAPQVPASPVKRSPVHAALRAGRFGVSSPLATHHDRSQTATAAIAPRERSTTPAAALFASPRKMFSTPATSTARTPAPGARRFLPVSRPQGIKRSASMLEEPDVDEEEAFMASQQNMGTTHNPFDVSEELEEPVDKERGESVGRPGGHQRFLMRPAPHGSPAPLSDTAFDRASAHERRSSMRFLPLGRDVTESGPVLPTDWSPAKKRTDKFLPGGMAELVALWIYEARVTNEAASKT